MKFSDWMLFSLVIVLGTLSWNVEQVYHRLEELPNPQITVVATNTIIERVEQPIYQMPQYQIVTNFTLPSCDGVFYFNN